MKHPSHYPLSFEQERMWFLSKLHGAAPAFHERAGAWLQGPLDVSLLKQTIAEITRRHEILRTSLVEVGEQPSQRIALECDIPWREEDARTAREEGAQGLEEKALTLAREEVSRPLDLEHGPLWRVCLVRLNHTRHLLVVTMHHLISDGDWTLGLFFSELFSLYTARREGQSADVPAIHRQYRDHALWQREQLSKQTTARQLAWWQEQLQGLPPALDLPVDRPRPSIQSFAGGTAERLVSPELTQAARALAEREGVTLFAVLLSGLQAVLYRYTHQEDVPVGTPLAGRHSPDVKHLLGYFGNPVVLRGRVGDDPSFRQFVLRTQQDFTQAQAHGDLSFKDLVEALSPARDLSRPPLFQVLFALRDPWPSTLTSPALTLTPVDIELPFVAYELMSSARDLGTGLSLKLEYNRELFLPESAAQLLGHWEALLRGALAAPEQRLSEIPLLSAEQTHQLLYGWNQTQADYPKDVSIHEAFQAQVRCTPEAVALVFGDRKLTYRELDRRAHRLACALRQRGVKAENRVALFTQRSPETIIAMLAILEAGGAYVPLDPELPAERLAWMIEDAQAKVVVAVGSSPLPLPVEGLELLRVDTVGEPPADEELPPLPSGVRSSHLAYVLYTSGSTGTPKGVAITHRSVVQLAFHADLSPDDHVLQSTTYSFDVSVYEIWGALLNGARVVMGARDLTLSARALQEELRRQAITVCCLTPAVFNNLVRETPSLFRPVRAVIIAGEALDPHWVRVAIEEGHAQLFNGYGPTEATVFTHLHPITEVPEGATSIPIGRPLPNVQAYVLDRHLQPVPRGVPGELYLGGEGLARGYWRQPELTVERFIPHPFSREPGARLYKTGDLVRYLPGGLLDFLGRIDHQVKVRGFRIELGEIEAVLDDHPAVRQAVVAARVLGSNDKQLVAYVVPQTSPPPSITELREYLARKLPSYMVPAFFVMLEALPLNPNGKVDRRALPVPDGTRPELAQEFVAPRTATEQALAAIWRECLSLDRVGLEDDFFALGGHSLRALQVMARIRQHFQVEIPLRAFFSHPTLAGLAGLLSQARSKEQIAASIPSAPRGAVVPLSFAQERLWFLHQLAPESAAYNYPAFFRVRGPLDAAVLEKSLQALVSRHESLRTRFSEVDGQPVQVIAAHLPLHLERVDLRELPREEQQREVHRRAEASARQPFDLHRAPLLRASLLTLGDDEHVLLLNLHHSVTDGWSMDVLYSELEALYGAWARGQPPALPALALQYADHAVWQRQWAETPAMEEQLTWWKQQLAGAPPVLELPTDRPRPPVQDFRGALVPFRIGKETTAALRALATQERVTPTMVLLAAFQALLHRYTGQEEFLVGMPHASRERPETEGVVGFFVNTLPIRADLSGAPSFRTLLARVRETSLGALEHAEVPFEQLVKALRPERDLSTLPLVQVMFAPQVSQLGRLKLPGLDMEPLALDPGRATFDLTLLSWEDHDALAGQWEYSTALFDPSTLERMAGHLCRLLEGAVRQPDARLSGLPMLGEEERQRLLVQWNDTAAVYPRDSTIPEAFAEQVLRAPEAVAVQFGSRQLTYRQLDLRANQLAWRLRRMGVGPDSRVAIAMERSLELVVALVGILKAGGAYVPLDTDYPRERLALMLEAAQPDALVTTKALLPKLPAQGLRHLLLDEARLEEEPASAPDSGVTARNLAYIDFTSGSTGRPKGVCIEHRSVLRLVKNIRYAELGPGETLLLASPLSFDASTFELWGSLLTGARLAVFPPHPPADPLELTEVIARHGVTCLWLSSGLFNQVVDVAAQRLAGVRRILVGGDVLSAPHVRRMVDLGVAVTNGYGPTECTTFAVTYSMEPHSRVEDPVPLGRPISNTTVYVLDGHLQPVPIGVAGELYLGGDGLARGYVGQPELTAERFVPDPFGLEPEGRLYKTGDRVRWRGDGTLEFLGRLDTQVKVRGHRIELAEVEAALLAFPSVSKTVAVAREDAPGQKRLVGYVVAPPELDMAALRAHLAERLPRYMQPSALVRIEELPLTLTGKIDRRALPAPSTSRPGAEQGFVAPRSELEQALGAIWQEVLGLERVGVDDPFFELGGHSLLLAQVRARIRERLERDVGMVTLFQYPTIRQLAAHLSPGESPAQRVSAPQEETSSVLARQDHAIAIIGMAGRFPGARSPRELWELLREGREGLSRFTPEELQASGLPPELLRDPSFVPALGMVEEAAHFDAAFFGYSPQEAQLTDPQQRLFLECAWEALEDSGYDPHRYPSGIGVFGGAGVPRYWLQRVASLGSPRGSSGDYRAIVGNGNDFLATRVAYKLGLRGPALSLQTACSTSLVAIHLACQSLLSGQCDMALAGGVSLFSMDPSGYPYEEGGILSPDGYCRPFDAQARGTVPGSGVAVVVLKRLEKALADGDTVHAVILGSAINNDGAQKIGYTAPSVEGQIEAIVMAQTAAGVSPETLSYVEAHGTATPLGDPIEVAALTQAFRRATAAKQSCALGSLKSNLGHLDAAAGVTGLLKVALSLEHELIPATLHFQRPNPELALEDSPFFVNAEPHPWPRGEWPRRAAVSAFGIGGTNAHAILEEAPPRAPSGPSRPWQLLPLSGRTATALEAITDRLGEHLRRQPELPLPDVAFTLQQGRGAFEHRRGVVCQERDEAVSALASRENAKVFDGAAPSQASEVIFMFPGGGTQHVGMGRELYQGEPVYRETLDRCAGLFAQELGRDLRSLLFAPEQERAEATSQLLRPSLNMASIFSTEYALAQLLLSWGLRPSALTGHSLGEYAAATLAGVLSLEDAVALVALRGRLCDSMPESAMLSVPLSEQALSARWAQGVSVAAINGPAHCVVAGRREAIEQLEARLHAGGIEAQRLWLAGASHSPLVEPFAARLTERAASMKLQAPVIPVVSNLTGTWMTDADARDPSYWARHLRGTVRFADGLSALLARPAPVLIEVGPGRVLASLARLHPEAGKARLVTSTLSTPGSGRSDWEALLGAVGKFWCVGGELDWAAFSRDERRQRVPLPTYPFERAEHLLGAPQNAQPASAPILKAPPVGRDALEQGLAEIWREVLGVHSIQPDDHFFDAGGSSLIALQLRTRVRAQLGVMLPVHALVENPRFTQLLDAVRRASTAAPSSPERPATPQGQLRVCLQEGAAGSPPLYLVQPIGGTVYTYMGLARQLGPQQPVYAFRASGIEPGEPIHPDVPTMAAHYIAEMLKHQPRGPFQLGGHSSGGAVAYEMARQLVQRGLEVSPVLLVDTPPLPLSHLQVGQPEDLLKLMAPFRERAPAAWAGMAKAVAKDSPFRELLMVHAHALAAYTPRRSQLPLLYIRAKERNEVLEHHAEQWWMDHTDGAFSMHTVPGDHFTLMEFPHIEAVARVVRQHLIGGGERTDPPSEGVRGH
ncbi:hybrid non-ribosomal peptide synthetase/type I polyketide synthase [Hyalangium minutum]|uniref:Long-chain-fatty-acid--CoA ligase n=1 Tax=Hyalangium minutum TaxID=394096 RepID=A0A085WW98_9BACT|nr:hybrid non-ribosomal peptide synthetase/type I polyketide synthase [Hyalangium minutum]KFE71961.1 Long-chain-fatty-acid--CoA ligase [Hyalangium minutum]